MEVSTPKVNDSNQLLIIKVDVASISGLDLKIFAIPPDYPANNDVILGHEYVGKIVYVGKEVTALLEGYGVAVEPNIPFGECEYGIEFCSMAARVSDYYSMVAEPGQEEHEIVKSGLEAAIGACKAMKIPRLLVPNFEKSAIRTERHFDIVADVLKWACDLAGDDVVIAAENTLSPARTKELFRAVNRENLGLYFDFQNYYLHNDVYTPDILEELYDFVVELHVKDGRNKDLSGALLGTGAANFEELAAVLHAREYDGWIVTENYYDMPPLCGPGEDPVVLIKKDMETLRKTFS